MIRTSIGKDYEGVWAVKITKGSRDPRTIPDSERAAFHFNSKWSADVKIAGIDSTPSGAAQYWPAGATEATYTKKRGASPQPFMVVRNTHFGAGLPYDLPIFDIKYRQISTNRYVEQGRVFNESGEDPAGREAGYRTMVTWSVDFWYQNAPAIYGPVGSAAFGNALFSYLLGYSGSYSGDLEKTVVVWRLPGKNEAIRDGAPQTQLPGQHVAEINANHCRVAKRGFDVRTATATQLAFDSSGRPLSIISAGDIAIPTGTTVVELNYPVDNTTVCDMLVYDNGVITFPISGYFTDLRVEYYFSGTKLYIVNPFAACRVRYMVLANNRLGTTSGPNEVWRQFSEGGQDVMQFLRPGSADPPNIEDIILDSRWPSLQILAEGYQSVPTPGVYTPPGSFNPGNSFTVDFDGTGLFPFVKYVTIHQDANGLHARQPTARLIENYNNSTRYNASGTSFCTLTANQAVFSTFEGNPVNERYTSGSWQFDYATAPMIGIRYYILGIPQP